METIAALEHYREAIVAGTRVVPHTPSRTSRTAASGRRTVTTTLTVTFDGSTCRYERPNDLGPGTFRVEFVNNSAGERWVDIAGPVRSPVEVPAGAGSSNSGYAGLEVDGRYAVTCHAGPTTFTGPELST